MPRQKLHPDEEILERMAELESNGTLATWPAVAKTGMNFDANRMPALKELGLLRGILPLTAQRRDPNRVRKRLRIYEPVTYPKHKLYRKPKEDVVVVEDVEPGRMPKVAKFRTYIRRPAFIVLEQTISAWAKQLSLEVACRAQA